MKLFFERALAIAAAAAVLASISPAHAQTSNQGVVLTVVQAFPTPAQVTNICKLDSTPGYVAQTGVLTAPFSTGTATLFGEPLSISILAAGTEFNDTTLASQQAGTPGVEAVVAGTTQNAPANVYCRINLVFDSGIFAPGGVVPTRLEFYWSRGPCLLPQTPTDKVAAACAAYNGFIVDPAQQKAHYLQEHLVAPTQPVNMCGCPYDPVEDPGPQIPGVISRIATFCDSSLPAGAQGSCFCNPDLTYPALGSCPPSTNQAQTGLNTQATVTIGSGTCRRVVIGGTALYIGDTCF